MVEVQTALAAVKKVDEAVGVIARLIAKLKAQPDLAALKLADALDEVAKTWSAMDSAITDYLRLGIETDAVATGTETLLRIEGGALLTRVTAGRGHCHVISNIFEKHLDRWFERALKGSDLSAIRNVFFALSSADYDVFWVMEEVAKQLQSEANAVLDMVLGGSVDDARRRVRDTRTALQPLRLAMSEGMQKLYGLKSDFIIIAGVA